MGSRRIGFSGVVAALFVAFIASPMLLQGLTDPRDVLRMEMRKAAPWPGFPSTLESLADFPAGVERYLHDRFGLRKAYIALNSLMRLPLGASGSPRVLIGRDGWLYLRETPAAGNVIDQYRGVRLFSEEELEQLIVGLEAWRDWLGGRGIPFFFVVTPDKHTIYPEHLPNSVLRYRDFTALDQLGARIEERGGIEFIDLRPALRAAKSGGALYFRTDTHWNQRGGFVGYREIARRIGERFPNLPILNLGDFDVISERCEGRDLARTLAIAAWLSDEEVKLRLRGESAVVERRSLHDAFPATRVARTRRGELPRLLVYHDSDVNAMQPFLEETFAETALVNHQRGKLDPAAVDRFRPDVVVLQVVERHAFMELERPPGWLWLPKKTGAPAGAIRDATGASQEAPRSGGSAPAPREAVH